MSRFESPVINNDLNYCTQSERSTIVSVNRVFWPVAKENI